MLANLASHFKKGSRLKKRKSLCGSKFFPLRGRAAEMKLRGTPSENVPVHLKVMESDYLLSGWAMPEHHSKFIW